MVFLLSFGPLRAVAGDVSVFIFVHALLLPGLEL